MKPKMQLLLLAALFSVGYTKSGSLECYDVDENGDKQYDYNGDIMLEICECDSSELAQFVGHIGNECFENGKIPAEVWEGFYSGCPNNGNNDNNNNNNNNNNGYYCNENEGDEQKFWCDCFGKYLNRYGEFPDGCWIPTLSEAMREIGGKSMEAAWTDQGCEWFDFSESRIVPEDVSIKFGPLDGNGASSGSFSVTTDETTWASVVALSFNFETLQEAYLAATEEKVMCNLDENGYYDNGGEYGGDALELAWEIRDGWSYSDSATRYGSACSQEYTGDVFVSFYYPQSYDDNGYVEEVEEPEIFIGDMTERNPLYVGYNGQVSFGNSNNNGNNNGNNNNNNNGNDYNNDSGDEQLGGVGGAFSYSLYNKNDVDTYSIVISCADEAESVEEYYNGNNNNNNNNNDESEECPEYNYDKEACRGKTSRYAIPLMCANFAVMFSEEKSDDIPDTNDDFEDDENKDGIDDNDTNQNGIADWREAEIREELEGTGLTLESESGSTGKTVGLILLGLCCVGLCGYVWKTKSSNGYTKAPGTNANDNTPLATGQQL